VRFNLLGPLEVTNDGSPVPLGGVKQRAALGFLLLHANEVIPASRLLQALWADEVPPTARKILHNAISGLRRTVFENVSDADSALLTRAPGYLLHVNPACVDLSLFQCLAERGRSELARGSWEPAVRLLRQALAFWRGSVLADLTEVGIVWPELAAVQDSRLTTFEDWVEAELALGRHHEVVGALEIAVATGPTRERVRGQLMLALYRCGQQVEALEVYRRTKISLAESLGLDPSRGLQELERAILNHDPILASAVPDGVAAWLPSRGSVECSTWPDCL
jgi:DNA-binding SARP family transcriptional activator